MHGHGSALADRAGDDEVAAMPLGDVLDDREAQPGAAERAAAARIDAVEAFGKPGQMLGRDAVAPIDDRQRDVAGIAGFESHRDRGAGAPVFHRFADEVSSEENTSEIQSLMRLSDA